MYQYPPRELAIETFSHARDMLTGFIPAVNDDAAEILDDLREAREALRGQAGVNQRVLDFLLDKITDIDADLRARRRRHDDLIVPDSLDSLLAEWQKEDMA